MQTFLPYADFKLSAKVLDSARLRKQQTEGCQITGVLFALDRPGAEKVGYRNHPAIKQWKGYTDVLQYYTYCIGRECMSRGFTIQQGVTLFPTYVLARPPWIGREDLHSSHRSRLLCKGMSDVYCTSIKRHFKLKKLDPWLKERYNKTKNQLRYADVLILKEFCEQHNIPIIGTSHYAQFNWTDDPSKEYVWPV